jgi:hypothetical protein
MKITNKRFPIMLFITAVLIITVSVSGWAIVNLPTANFTGQVQTTSGIGSGVLTFPYAYITQANYQDGTTVFTNGPDETLIGGMVTLSGATRTGDYTFSDAVLSIVGGDGYVYFSATLSNIQFVTDGFFWNLNPTLDIDDPSTLNLSNLSLNTDATHPSRYIDELAYALQNQDISGMKMILFTYIGNIAGDSMSAIVEGLIDGVPAAPNTPPTAEAGVIFNQDQCLAMDCEVTLDGRNSTDPDSTPGTQDDITGYEWYEDGQLIATGDQVTVLLPLGTHYLTLKVIDTAGNTSEDAITVVVDPAQLSFLELRKADVKWDRGEIKLKGKIAMPVGISHAEINPVGAAAIALSTLGNVVDESVNFTLINDEHGNEVKWEYKDKTKTTGITKFKIDWEGEKFKYKNGDLEIKTRHIGADRTTLEIELEHGMTGPVTVAINGVSIDIAADGGVVVTPSTLETDVDYEHNEMEVEVVLPFALAPDMAMNVSGVVNDDFLVQDYYTAAVGKFKIDARFDASGIDVSLLDPALTLDIALGDQGFNGVFGIDSAEWQKVTNTKWKFKVKD